MNTNYNLYGIKRLSELLRVDQNVIVNLSIRGENPLPLPSEHKPHDPWTFDEVYLKKLCRWIQKESKEPIYRSMHKMNLDEAMNAIKTMTHYEPECDFVNNFPPGYFLG